MYTIYTDGSYSSKRQQGGWAFIVLKDGIIVHKHFLGVTNTTNNRMELTAVIEALKWLNHNVIDTTIIYSDSMYVIGTINQGWKRKTNLDLWEQLDKLYSSNIIFKTTVSFQHVYGHADNQFNNSCDTLAVIGSQALIYDNNNFSWSSGG